MCARFTGVELTKCIRPVAGAVRAGPRELWPVRSQRRCGAIVRGLCRRGVCGRDGRCTRGALGTAAACCGPRGTSLPLGGCAGLARNSRSSNGARSKRRIIACISSAVGASTNAKPFDSCVSWLRITFTASATRSSAASHCLMSSAVTHVGRLPRKTVKLIQLICLLRWLDLRHFKGRIPIRSQLDSIRLFHPIANEVARLFGTSFRHLEKQ